MSNKSNLNLKVAFHLGIHREKKCSLSRSLALICGFVVVTIVQNSQVDADFVVHSPWVGAPDTTDLFDVANGAIVTANSPMLSPFVPQSAIGFERSSGIEPSHTYFRDTASVGTVDFINIRTPNLVSISGFNFYSYDDTYSGGSGANRGMGRFSLLSSVDGITFTTVQNTFLFTDYTAAYGSHFIQVSATFSPITSQYFRFEAVRSSIFGPRIVEIDAISAVPEPSAISCTILCYWLITVRIRKP